MICPLCEGEIEEGSVICKHCGRPIQVVPDYNVLEDDVLPAMLDSTRKKEVSSENTKEHKRQKKKMHIMIAMAVTIAALVLLSVTLYRNSYTYYYGEGDANYKNKNYDIAISYYEKALAKSQTYDIYVALGKAYYRTKDFTSAEETLQKAYELKNDGTEAVMLLAKIYNAIEDYDKLDELFALDLTEEQRIVLSEYESFAPVFSLAGGKFDTDVEVELFSKDGYDIYYPLDSTTPSEHNGRLYTEPLKISEQGKTVVSAICINADGKASNVSMQTYEISYVAPETPQIHPAGGVVTKQTFITITDETQDVSLYYTWDDTMPTVDSAKYDEPIEVPEGNNVLSVIAIDGHGMSSGVLKSNFIYYP